MHNFVSCFDVIISSSDVISFSVVLKLALFSVVVRINVRHIGSLVPFNHPGNNALKFQRFTIYWSVLFPQLPPTFAIPKGHLVGAVPNDRSIRVLSRP